MEGYKLRRCHGVDGSRFENIWRWQGRRSGGSGTDVVVPRRAMITLLRCSKAPTARATPSKARVLMHDLDVGSRQRGPILAMSQSQPLWWR